MYENHQGHDQQESVAMSEYGHYGGYEAEPDWQQQRHESHLSMQVIIIIIIEDSLLGLIHIDVHIMFCKSLREKQ